MKKWLYLGWYQYLLADLQWCDNFKHKIEVIICRVKGHPKGPIWYNLGGFEPNMCCKECGDEI